VSDNITIRPAVSSNDIKSDIEAALKRWATTNARNLSVNVKGANATLSGTVDNQSERKLARHTA
jgi:osmotically-inducible protein OsmY